MTNDPWIDPDPQPGDFDTDVAAIDARYVEAHQGNPNAKLTIVTEERADRSRTPGREPGARPSDS